MDEAIRALACIKTLSRTAVRRRFDQRFTAERMAQEYLKASRHFHARIVSSCEWSWLPLNCTAMSGAELDEMTMNLS
jgi:hypothetical protein